MEIYRTPVAAVLQDRRALPAARSFGLVRSIFGQNYANETTGTCSCQLTAEAGTPGTEVCIKAVPILDIITCFQIGDSDTIYSNTIVII